jgi:SAM-dependent methyltransferase
MTTEDSSACKVKVPAPELIAVLEGLTPGTALDLAAGSGRHAVWLAQRGWNVTAVDIAIPEESSGRVKWIQADLEQRWVPFAGELVICWLYWQADLLPAIAAAAKPGGIVALAGKTSGRFATSLDAYREAFTGWEELSAGEDGVKAWFIARKC